ncbi:type II toxin-antitoxin system RelE/ParE family toxin [Chelativorans sp. ZYF759]|uniref:type II toxin-antitoxin system RelE/ParE family toxin n=1 Tax=Chelativorans sp. ZYF759 TaxID=2692213 RepID=UPI00145D5775|nr:type II toxin-antitoxin system RelE/ParE family toxin [Chelativorans sp. ZYF759]NMG39002.1 type II toxin-antitoxin system RelE/ParE family toxin [Chelativorans sp. ZYF759]
MRVVEYLDERGVSPFAAWFSKLGAGAATKIAVALERMSLGNLENAKGVGAGVMEHRIDSGPGYRIYFGQDGAELVILLAGGTKQRQQRDIKVAQARWNDYRQRKKRK